MTARREPVPCQADPDRWFSRRRTVRAEAAQACLSCRLVEVCLEAALEAGAEHGVWGGVDLDEQRLTAKRRAVLDREVAAAQAAHRATASASRRAS